jgi:hypothetical protein
MYTLELGAPLEEANQLGRVAGITVELPIGRRTPLGPQMGVQGKQARDDLEDAKWVNPLCSHSGQGT